VTTIAEIVIAASVEPSGVAKGLDQALGFSKRFAQEADVIFKSVGPGQDNVLKAQQVAHRIESEFLRARDVIKEQLARGVDPNLLATRAREAGTAMNQALLAALEGFRTKGIFDPEAEHILINKIKGDIGGLGLGGNSSLGKTAGLIGDLGRLSHGGAAGLGLMRREMLSLFSQLTGTIPLLDRLGNTLLSYQTGGAISFGVIAGLTAIAGGYYLITKSAREAAEQNKKALESIRAEIDKTTMHISERAVLAADAEVKSAQDKVNRLNQQSSAFKGSSATQQTFFGQTQFTTTVVDRAKQDQELRDANRDLAVAIQNRNNLQRQARKDGDQMMDDELNSFIKHGQYTMQERKLALARLKDYQEEAAKLQRTGADNQRRMFLLGQIDDLKDTLFPKQKAIRDKEPFPELHSHIQDLATAYRDLREQGIKPTIALQSEAEDQFLQLGRRIAMLPDQTGRAARSLLEMQRLLLTAGIHANDALLNPQIQIGPALGNEDATANELVKRASEARDAVGPLNDAALAALSAERRFQQVVEMRIENQFGVATTDQLNALKKIKKDVEDAQKDLFNSVWTPEEQINLEIAIKDFKELTTGTRVATAGFDAMKGAISGVLNVLNGFGVATDHVREIAQGINQIIDATKNFAKLQNQNTKKGGSAADKVGAGQEVSHGINSVLDGLGKTAEKFGPIGQAIAGGLEIIHGVIGLFSHHNQALEDNTKKLDQLRESMVDTKGLAGFGQEQDALRNIRNLFNTPAFKIAGSNQKNAMIEEAVNQAGLSIDQFNKILHDFGIEPEKSGKWIDQFNKALQLAAEAATKFHNTLEDQRTLIELHNKVFGKDTPQDALQGNIDLLNRLAPVLGSAITSIDTTTTQGQAQLRDALKNWVTMLENGVITPEQLGELTGVKDFAQIIGALSDSLDELTKKTEETTNAMSVNIPAWYKVAAARFTAADPWAPPINPLPVPTGTFKPPTIPGGMPQLPTGLAPRPLSPLPQGSGMTLDKGVTINGDVLIDARQLSAREMFDAILAEGQRRASNQFRDSTKWAQVQN
jgi:hypothetical protein